MYINMDPYPSGLLISWTYSICFGQFFFAESVLTSYNFLASLQIIFNLKNGQLKFLDTFFFIYYLLSILGRRELIASYGEGPSKLKVNFANVR